MAESELIDGNSFSTRRPLLLAIGLLTLTWLAYLPALHGSAIWDDRVILTQSQILFSPHALWRIWFDLRSSPDYFPLTLTAFWLQLHLWSTADLTGFHTVNVLLHFTNAMLVWRLLRRLQIRGSFLAAALFAVHPIMVESVAWVSELKNTLSGNFALLTLLCFFHKATWRWALTAAVLYSVALLAKTAVVGLPPAIITLLWWQRRRPTASQKAALAVMFVTAAAMAMLSLWLQKNVVGAKGPEFDHTLLQRLSIVGPALAFYLFKLLLPILFSLIYPLWTLPTHLGWQHATGLLIILGILALWAGQPRWGRGPCAAALIFVIMLAPVLGMLSFYSQRYSFVANHYTYLACIPMFAVISSTLFRSRRVAIPVAAAVVACCALQSFIVSRSYRSELVAFQNIVCQDPDNWEGNAVLGSKLIEANHDAEAEPYLWRAAHTYPQAGEVWVGLGQIAERAKHYDLACDRYRKATQLRPMAPIVHFDLANMLLITHHTAEAIDEYRTAIELEPNLVAAHDNLGVALLKAGDAQAAEAEFRIALSIDPNFPSAQKHLLKLQQPRTGVAGPDAP